MQIESDLDLIQKAHGGTISLPEISNYLKSKYKEDLLSLELLKAETYRFKLENTIDKIKFLNEDPKFISRRLDFEKKGIKMPLIDYMLETENESIPPVEYYEIMQSELKIFINEFLPTTFIGVNKVDLIIDGMLNNNPKSEMDVHKLQAYVEWTDNTQVKFFEVFKGLEQSGLIKFKTKQTEVFEFLRRVFNIEKFSVNGAIKTSKKRGVDENVFHALAYDLDDWRKKYGK